MNKENQIFRELQHLTENADPLDFLKASENRGVSRHMKSALELLALECLRKSRNIKRSRFPVYQGRTPERSRLHKENETFLSGKVGTTTEIDQIYEILINSKRLINKIAMVDFAKYIGLRVSFNTKDSRIRTARKLAKAIVFSPGHIKKKSLSVLNEIANDQTQGWFDIILKK